jgi:putative two-component system response regulator
VSQSCGAVVAPAPGPVEREQDLARIRKQLVLYARDLKQTLDAERRRAGELESAYYDTVLRLMLASQYRDDETGEHIRRIVDYVRRLALGLGIDGGEAELLAAAAALHDVGKIAIDDAILRKPGPLTAAEWKVMKRHTTIGARILEGSPSPLLKLGHDIALTHHESWDGTGYPRGLAGEDIPLAGRLVMLADRYDALRSRRPYKPAFDHETAVRMLLHEDDVRTRPAHFEPRLLELFTQIHPDFDAIWRTWQLDGGVFVARGGGR